MQRPAALYTAAGQAGLAAGRADAHAAGAMLEQMPMGLRRIAGQAAQILSSHVSCPVDASFVAVSSFCPALACHTAHSRKKCACLRSTKTHANTHLVGHNDSSALSLGIADCQLGSVCLQPGLPFPEDLRHLFGDLSGLSGRGAGFGRPAAGFTMGTELAQAHAQAGTRAGGWAEGVGSSATAVNSLAGLWTILATHSYQ